MTTVLHNPRAGMTEAQVKSANDLIERRRRLNGRQAPPASEAPVVKRVPIDSIVRAMKCEAEPPKAPAESWADRQRRLNAPPDVKPMWFSIVEEIEPSPRRARIEDIQRAVATRYNVSRDDLMCARRTANIVRPRQIAMYLAKTMTLRSLPEIGRRFGGRDHTTVLHAVRKIDHLVGKDPVLHDEVQRLTDLIRGMD